MTKKTLQNLKYEKPDWNNGEEYFSYYSQSKVFQENLQDETLKRHAKSPALARELALATHSHAAKFFDDVGEFFEIDCKKGCVHCCHQPVTLFAFEAIRIAEVLSEKLGSKELQALEKKLKKRLGEFGTSVKANVNNKTPCPLLVENQCSVYDDRPMTCRMAHSFSVNKCRVAFEKDRNKSATPVSMEIISAMSGIIEAAYEKLPERNLDGRLFELSSALLAVLGKQDIAQKWASGDQTAFIGCVVDDT